MTRTFVAVELPQAVRDALTREMKRMQRELPRVRWVDPASLHLTLAFLGEVDDASLASVQTATEDAARASAPFSLRTDRLGTFGPHHAPSVIWVGVGGEMSALLALQNVLAERLAEVGFPREQRPFAAHLTLARLKTPLPADALARLQALLQDARRDSTSWRVGAVSVMKSELLPAGARYTPLAAYPLVESR